MPRTYYLVCPEKKIYMILFTVEIWGINLSDRNWIYKFVVACEDSEIKLLCEGSPEMPTVGEKKDWTYIFMSSRS